VCCGDWKRAVTPAVTWRHGLTGVFLDPPYADTAKRTANLYAIDSLSVAHEVREWAISHGDDPKMRIALCGYEGEHTMPESWACVPWKAQGGYGSPNKANLNPHKERIWFSPHCLAGELAKAA
jgi:DNA adenine methylase